MANIHVWIQLENKPWDACPNNISRVTGQTIKEATGQEPVTVTLHSPETGVSRSAIMYRPMDQDALILRRYQLPQEPDESDAWTIPDDRKVNPWDLNEPDPTDDGSMGTIPGPTLECIVGDRLIVHFRNKDFRKSTLGDGSEHLSINERTHSLHPHGIAFAPQYDGAYPLSPIDPDQPVGDEADLWKQVGVNLFKQGDRVPPGGMFTYIWDTLGWPTTAGVWHYHDHSICDVENVKLGAIGFLVIHKPEDPDDVIEQDLPNDQLNGPLTEIQCFLLPTPVPVSSTDLENVRRARHTEQGLKLLEEPENETRIECHDKEEDVYVLKRGDTLFKLDQELTSITHFCLPIYVDPPEKAQYLQYYHELSGVGMTINGRRFLGNTPTLIGGLNTKMRFGLVAMNSLTFHTFHLHGHRWVIKGPRGNNPTDIQGSSQVQAVSQFEDTKLFGPANSFSFTVTQGSFMGSRFSPTPERAPGLGEWHMHCHVLNHMMPGGMMGSLKVIQGGELALFMPHGALCDTEEHEPGGNSQDEDGANLTTIVVDRLAFTPNTVTVRSGSQLTFDFKEANHTVTTTSTTGAAVSIEINNGSGSIDPIPAGQTRTITVTGNPGDEINYHCGIHLEAMIGKIVIA